MEINNIFYGIILYIIIIITLVFLKPQLIYDNIKKKYKEFGITENCTIFTLPILSVFIALIISTGTILLQKKNENSQNLQYILVPYYQNLQQQIPPVQIVYDPRMFNLSNIANISNISNISNSTLNS